MDQKIYDILYEKRYQNVASHIKHSVLENTSWMLSDVWHHYECRIWTLFKYTTTTSHVFIQKVLANVILTANGWKIAILSAAHVVSALVV